MKVLLAGFNIDTEVIKDLIKNTSRLDVTPETLSASYARISRDPHPVDQLRQIARQEVEKARRSNKNIIFKMGHHSVAEHAIFNFDIIGVSRLALEEIEKFRLCSYTEKSQRYITLGNDFVIPEELRNTSFKEEFRQLVQEQNKLYHLLYEKLRGYVFTKYSTLAQDPKQHNLLEGWAKEDARYVTSLATEGQLGETINARNLEFLFRRFASHPLQEIQTLGQKIYQLVEQVAPSIILFTQANDFDRKTYPALRNLTSKIIKKKTKSSFTKDVELVNYTPQADNITMASLLHTSSKISFKECLLIATRLSMEKKKEIIKTSCQYLELYDAILREFEYVDLTYNLVVSATCFAQLKRHRMVTLTCQEYDPQLGVTIPESIKEIKMEKAFRSIIEKTNKLYYKIYLKMPIVAPYVLTNAHRKRILIKTNARELYHISRLRLDTHAQWDIRQQTQKMTSLAQKVMPLTMLFIGGKDSYPDIYRQVFGRPPKVIQATLPQ